jgi:hypothetical protein
MDLKENANANADFVEDEDMTPASREDKDDRNEGLQ